MKKKEKTLDEIIVRKGYDPYLIEEIQPQGGISFKDEKFINTGDGYEACIHIYKYPKNIDSYWLATVMNLNNVVTLLDISTEDINEVKKNINRSMKEQNSRYDTAKNPTDMRDAEQKYQELDRMYEEISSMGEIVKIITIRMLVSGRTVDETDKEVKRFLNYLESNGYKAAVFLNESRAEWKSMYQTYSEQQETEYKRYGQPILSESLANGDPFHFTSLSDENGTYLGSTLSTNGNVLFDMFTITSTRKSYNGLCVGTMGSGKSTTLKKLMLDMAIRGHYIRGFDVTGEFQSLVEYLGGQIVSLDGTDGILNALEILKTDDSESISYSQHLSKLSTIYKFLAPYATIYEVVEFEELIDAFYKEIGIVTNDWNKPVTGLPSERYPIWSEFLEYIEKLINATKAKGNIQEELAKVKIKRLDNIRLVIKNIVKNYGHIFNGHTNISSVTDNQIVFFNIKNLSSMKSEIFDAQMFTALSLCWDNCVRIGNVMKKRYDEKEIAWEDITRFMIFIDEAHHIINTNKLTAVTQLLKFGREARKYFGGLLFASQSIRDFVKEGSDNESIDQIKTLFELTQYKFIMQQDSNSMDILNRVFGHQLTESEIYQIPRLQKGECILAISSDKNIRFNIEITDEEKDLFKGGA